MDLQLIKTEIRDAFAMFGLKDKAQKFISLRKSHFSCTPGTFVTLTSFNAVKNKGETITVAKQTGKVKRTLLWDFLKHFGLISELFTPVVKVHANGTSFFLFAVEFTHTSTPAMKLKK